MFGLFRRRQTSQDTGPVPSKDASTEADPLLATAPESTATTTNMPSRPIAPYEVPDPQGRCFLMDMPEELLVRVFTDLDRCTVSKCFRVSYQAWGGATTSSLVFHLPPSP